MSRNYKRKKEIVEQIIDNDALSKKEQYDLAKKEKMNKKVVAKKKKVNKKKQTNLGARIFAIFMLLLMISSVIISSLAYVMG